MGLRIDHFEVKRAIVPALVCAAFLATAVPITEMAGSVLFDLVMQGTSTQRH